MWVLFILCSSLHQNAGPPSPEYCRVLQSIAALPGEPPMKAASRFPALHHFFTSPFLVTPFLQQIASTLNTRKQDNKGHIYWCNIHINTLEPKETETMTLLAILSQCLLRLMLPAFSLSPSWCHLYAQGYNSPLALCFPFMWMGVNKQRLHTFWHQLPRNLTFEPGWPQPNFAKLLEKIIYAHAWIWMFRNAKS